MNAKRFWRHVMMSPLGARRCFPPATLDAIEHEVAAQEKRHRGEVCFVVEAELTSAQLWREVSSRDRAREIFALRGVWNTEENNGVLIYVLLADRKVEIVADRGVDRKAAQDDWHAIRRTMEDHFRAGRFAEGAIAGARAVSEILVLHYPASADERNELGDRPVLM